MDPTDPGLSREDTPPLQGIWGHGWGRRRDLGEQGLALEMNRLPGASRAKIEKAISELPSLTKRESQPKEGEQRGLWTQGAPSTGSAASWLRDPAQSHLNYSNCFLISEMGTKIESVSNGVFCLFVSFK